MEGSHSIELTVPGIVQSQGSKRVFINKATGKPALVEAGGAAHKEWRSAVAKVATDWLRQHPQLPLDEPVSVHIDAFFPLPASDPDRVRVSTTPDVDKVARSVLDSLTDSGLLKDDARVWALSAHKWYARDGWVGAIIGITPNGETEQRDRAERKARRRQTMKGTKNEGRGRPGSPSHAGSAVLASEGD